MEGNNIRPDGWRAPVPILRVEGEIFKDPQPGTVPLKLWWSEGRGDNFTTTSWSRPEQPGYAAAGRHVEGHVFDPARPQPAGTIELWSVWSPTRQDNFLTTDPTWWGNTFGQRVGPADHDYVFARREGWIFPLIEVQLTTGDDDLRGGNMAFIKLNLKNGTSTPEIVLGRGFTGYSNVRVPLSFTQSLVVSDIESITVRHDGSPRSGHPVDTYDNWNLQDFVLRVPGGQIIYDSRRDRRLPLPHRFTGASREITLKR